MIFVTVGTQLPFDRLVRAVDAWAERTGGEAFAQIAGGEPPRRIGWTRSLTPASFDEHLARATVVVAHAGMGTILSCLRSRRPLLVLPRRAELGEHRNDHQVATARRLAASGRLNVAMDESELGERLDAIGSLGVPEAIGAYAEPGLLAFVRSFVRGEGG